MSITRKMYKSNKRLIDDLSLDLEKDHDQWKDKVDKQKISMTSCNCIGKQNGEPLCPCMMRSKKIRKANGRWIQPQQDLGPVLPKLPG